MPALPLAAAALTHSSRGMATGAVAVNCGPSLPDRFTALETCLAIIPGHSLDRSKA